MIPLLVTLDWISDAEALKKQVPADVEETLEKHEAEASTNHPDYRKAEYSRSFARRSAPSPPNPASRGTRPFARGWGPDRVLCDGQREVV